MTALTNLHRKYAGEIQTEDLLNRIQERQNVISSAYEKLYQNKNYPFINMKTFVEELLSRTGRNHSGRQVDIRISAEIAEKELPLKRAVPIAQIIMELFTNSHRHAFNDFSGEKKISISLKEDNQNLVILYSDNGPGLPEEIIPEQAKTLGMLFIKSLSRQLGAKPEFNKTEEGLTFSLIIDDPEKKN